MRETDRKIKELTNLFTGQWGKLIEALIKPGSLKLFQDRGINVQKRKTRMAERLNGGRHMEIDILLKNKVEKIAVVIEVKTTLQISDVNDFIKKFDTFLDFFPRSKDHPTSQRCQRFPQKIRHLSRLLPKIQRIHPPRYRRWCANRRRH
jgi:signal-transduction protein with cAMP-binding, CBS, and nucleotidyltransferase domain